MNLSPTTCCFLGIDIAKGSFNVHLLRPDGGKDQAAQFTNDPAGFAALDVWLLKHALATDTLHAARRPLAPTACRC